MVKSWRKRGTCLAAAPLVLFAETHNWDFEGLAWNILRVVSYGLLGLAIFGAAYLIIDKMTPFSFGRELLENKNVAVAVVLAGVFIGIALILAAAISG